MSANPTQYKTMNWSNPAMLLWMINPGLAVNEVLLGQRVPRKMLIEKDPYKSLPERTWVPCPHCDTLHPGLKWSIENKTAFGNWFGMYCDHCGNTIPCLHNIASLVLWGISFPLWAPFRKTWKTRWLAKQKQKFNQPLDLSTPTYNWVQEGIGFGLIVYLLEWFIIPLFSGEFSTGRELLIGIIPALLGGLGFGYTMRYFMKARRRTGENNAA